MINSLKKSVITLLILLFGFVSNSQEIIKEVEAKKDTIKTSSKRQKIDGIIAIVGDYNVLDSDIDKSFL